MMQTWRSPLRTRLEGIVQKVLRRPLPALPVRLTDQERAQALADLYARFSAIGAAGGGPRQPTAEERWPQTGAGPTPEQAREFIAKVRAAREEELQRRGVDP
jgi:hypothetical protein